MSAIQTQGESIPHRSQAGDTLDPNNYNPDSVLFKHDRLYKHSLLRINYTTYDVRRSQDVVNPSTSRCNIMLLADPQNDEDIRSNHPFRYARVLQVYHANVLYVGPGLVDYQPRRLEFLWVRWYECVDPLRTGWSARKLDRVRFLPVTNDDAFGFVDPSDVLRGCFVLPRFSGGFFYVDGKGLSHSAQDSHDYAQYFVNRCVCFYLHYIFSQWHKDLSIVIW